MPSSWDLEEVKKITGNSSAENGRERTGSLRLECLQSPGLLGRVAISKFDCVHYKALRSVKLLTQNPPI